MNGHIVPIKTYVIVLVVLTVLAVVTTEIATVDLGSANVAVALIIAGIKMMIVVLYFMHVKWSSYRIKLIPVAGLLWLAILIGLTASDYLSRTWLPVPGDVVSSTTAP